mgnify:CR=1 FL=1
MSSYLDKKQWFFKAMINHGFKEVEQNRYCISSNLEEKLNLNEITLFTFNNINNKVIGIEITRYHFLVFARINIYFFEVKKPSIWNKLKGDFRSKLHHLKVEPRLKNMEPADYNYYHLHKYVDESNLFKEYNNLFLGFMYFFKLHNLNQQIPCSIFDLN